MSPFLTNHPEFFPVPQSGRVAKDISCHQLGQVKFQASFWRAKLLQPRSRTVLHAGQNVIIVGREGLTLLVQPLSQ